MCNLILCNPGRWQMVSDKAATSQCGGIILGKCSRIEGRPLHECGAIVTFLLYLRLTYVHMLQYMYITFVSQHKLHGMQ
jgi:hypothetical protein